MIKEKHKVFRQLPWLVLLLIMSFFMSANEIQSPVTIAAGEMPYLLSEYPEFKGAYNQLMEEVDSKVGQTFNLIYLPPARAEQIFESKSSDCIMPGQMEGMDDKNNRIASEPFNYARAYIFNAIDQPVVKSVESLFGKVVATRRGFDYGKLKLGNKIKKFEVNNIQQSIEMLKKKRIDAFIAYEPDILILLERFPEQIVHRGDFIIHQQPEKIVCHRTEKTLNFIREFNQTIKQFSHSGELINILGSSQSKP